jgi:hypothetical protein
MTAPLPCRWTGEAFEPLPRYRAECDRHYVIGQTYRLTEYVDRSDASHNHQFGWLAEAWRNLPENLADLYPSPEHLRKRGLIEAGYYDEMAVDAGGNAAALRVASAFRNIDEFSLVIVRGPIVIRRTAKSQSRRAMGAKEFQESKSALMDVVAAMIGVTPDTLNRETGKAA